MRRSKKPLDEGQAREDDGTAAALAIYCAQLPVILDAAPRFPAAGKNRFVVEFDASLIDQMSQQIRYLLALRDEAGTSPPISR